MVFMSGDINKEANEILDKFGKDLDKLNVKLKPVEKKGDFFREEKNGQNCDASFKTIMFKNAKRKNDLYLLAEKGAWN